MQSELTSQADTLPKGYDYALGHAAGMAEATAKIVAWHEKAAKTLNNHAESQYILGHNITGKIIEASAATHESAALAIEAGAHLVSEGSK